MVGYAEGRAWDPHQRTRCPASSARLATRPTRWASCRTSPARQDNTGSTTWPGRRAGRAERLHGLAGRQRREAVEAGVAHGVSVEGRHGSGAAVPPARGAVAHELVRAREAVRFLRRRDPSAPFFLSGLVLRAAPAADPPRDYYDRLMAMDLPEPVVGDWAPGSTARSAVSTPTPRSCASTRPRSSAAARPTTADQPRRRPGRAGDARGRGRARRTLIACTSDHGETSVRTQMPGSASPRPSCMCSARYYRRGHSALARPRGGSSNGRFGGRVGRVR